MFSSLKPLFSEKKYFVAKTLYFIKSYLVTKDLVANAVQNAADRTSVLRRFFYFLFLLLFFL